MSMTGECVCFWVPMLEGVKSGFSGGTTGGDLKWVSRSKSVSTGDTRGGVKVIFTDCLMRYKFVSLMVFKEFGKAILEVVLEEVFNRFSVFVLDGQKVVPLFELKWVQKRHFSTR